MLNRQTVAASILAAAALFAPGANAEPKFNPRGPVQRVLLISIDGMHAVDFQNCMNGMASVNSGAPYCPALAALAAHGVNYTRTSTSKPSDSFPGLMSIVSGASPRLHGAFYDVAYDRVYAPPFADTGNGNFSGACNFGVPNGTTTEYEEGVDLDQTALNGGAPGAGLTDGGVAAIDPHKLPRDPFVHDATNGGCAPVWPWNFVRTNTIFGVLHAAGAYTAWSDKHPVYASVSGPTGTSSPTNLDDYYSPEINSNVIALPGVSTPSTSTNPGGSACSPIRDTAHVGSWTDTFANIQCYDTLKVQAILNEIDGKTHNGGPAQVPNLFGMNFQAVSVGQKLIEGATKGGYLDAAATPSAALLDEITFVDASIGEMVAELKSKGLFDTTLFIVTAKHGQSPIDPNRFKELGAGISTTPATIIASLLPPVESPNTPDKGMLSAIGPTEDDISLLWLTHSSDTATAVSMIESQADAAGVGEIFFGPSLGTMFNPPQNDSRTPDIIVQPYSGVIFTGSSKKQEEHGGFAHDDTNVMMLVSHPTLTSKTVTSFVETSQVAPTVLSALGLDPGALQGVQIDGTQVLPDLSLGK